MFWIRPYYHEMIACVYLPGRFLLPVAVGSEGLYGSRTKNESLLVVTVALGGASQGKNRCSFQLATGTSQLHRWSLRNCRCSSATVFVHQRVDVMESRWIWHWWEKFVLCWIAFFRWAGCWTFMLTCFLFFAGMLHMHSCLANHW